MINPAVYDVLNLNMKFSKLLFLLLVLAGGCAYDNTEIAASKSMKLLSEEYFTYDATSANGFVASFKKTFVYDLDKLVEVDAYDYNAATHSYEAAYPYEQYHYTSDGKLSQKVEFVGTSGLRWVEEYQYLNSTSTKVIRYESNGSGFKSLEDWWIMERTPSSLTVGYYQGNNELYAQLTYDIDSKGNVISMVGDPALPVGKVYFKYDNAPNPCKFVELGGEYGVDSGKYLSENNVVEITNDTNAKSARSIEYNDRGYPSAIITSTSKIVFTYR